MTVEEKIISHIEQNCTYPDGSPMMDEQTFYEGAKWGYNEAMRCQSNPKIKQLEWDGKEELAFFTAQTNIGEYMIDNPHDDGIFALIYTPDWSDESFLLHTSDSIDELKSFAQQD